MAGNLTLKWGTVKGWSDLDDNAVSILERFYSYGQSFSAMNQPMTKQHVSALCDLIDAVDEPIYNDWEGTDMSREEAKKYVREYRR